MPAHEHTRPFRKNVLVHEDISDIYACALTSVLTIPTRLKHHRERLGLSLRACAEEIGIGFNTLYRIEHGKQYTEEVLVKALVWLIGVEKVLASS